MLRPPEIRCPRISHWDGVSLDALRGGWSDTARLYLSENSSGQRPHWGTEVRIGWEDRALLVLFLCQDPKPWATLTEHDQPLDEPRLRWMLFLHLTFVVSGLLFAAMDWVGNRAEKPKEH